MTEPPATRRTGISILPILTVQFVGTLGFSIVLPFLVFLVTRWGGNALIYGVIGATYSAFQLVGAPLLGRWSDVHGRRKILLLSQLGTLLSWALVLVALVLPVVPLFAIESGPLGAFTLTLPLLVLFLARAFDGLTGGNLSVAQAYLADITPEDRRSASYGKMAVAGNLGFIFGPMLAGLLGGTVHGEILPVASALVISLIASVLIAVRLPESRPCASRDDPARARVSKVFGQEQRDCYEKRDQISASDILRLPHVPYLLTLYFLVMLGFNFFYVAFPVHAVRQLEWTVSDTGIFFAVLSLLMVIVQGPVLSRAARKISEPTLVLGGSFVLAVSFVFFWMGRADAVYAGAALLALGNGLMWPSLVAILSKAAGSRYQGAVQGFAGSCGAVASIIGLIVGGVLYDRVQEAIFLLSAAVILAVFLLSMRARRHA